MRADALRNRQKVLDAARAVFETEGLGVPLDEIARAAGVGPGTIYRHFPTQDALFEAVIEARVEDLVADARARAALPDAGEAFLGFLARLAGEAAMKKDLSDVLTAPPTVATELRRDMHAALETLLRRAQESGAIRAGVRTEDLIALLKGLLAALQAAPSEDSRRTLLEIVTAGLRTP
jgi:AcrR family transcriptional regulator